MLVLLAHRAPDQRARMRAILAAAGIDARDAGEDVPAAVRELRPDVVLVDDAGLVRRIASDPDLLGTAVVLIGAAGSVDEVLAAQGSGAHDVLPDPPSEAELLARTRAAARAAALRGQLLTREATLEQLAYNDELTGLWNRRFMQRRLLAALRLAERHDRPLSVALVDVDHFKAINDRHGHAVGDAVLEAVAGRLRRAGREEDVISRWGGEEFLVLLSDETEDGALAAGERLRTAVSGTPIDTPVGVAVPVTVSVGCATRRPGDDLDGLLRRADEALYAAKRAGRNAVAGSAGAV